MLTLHKCRLNFGNNKQLTKQKQTLHLLFLFTFWKHALKSKLFVLCEKSEKKNVNKGHTTQNIVPLLTKILSKNYKNNKQKHWPSNFFFPKQSVNLKKNCRIWQSLFANFQIWHFESENWRWLLTLGRRAVWRQRRSRYVIGRAEWLTPSPENRSLRTHLFVSICSLGNESLDGIVHGTQWQNRVRVFSSNLNNNTEVFRALRHPSDAEPLMRTHSSAAPQHLQRY